MLITCVVILESNILKLISSASFYYNVAIRKFKMTYVIYIMFLVDSTDWETLKTDQLNKQSKGYCGMR